MLTNAILKEWTSNLKKCKCLLMLAIRSLFSLNNAWIRSSRLVVLTSKRWMRLFNKLLPRLNLSFIQLITAKLVTNWSDFGLNSKKLLWLFRKTTNHMKAVFLWFIHLLIAFGKKLHFNYFLSSCNMLSIVIFYYYKVT